MDLQPHGACTNGSNFYQTLFTKEGHDDHSIRSPNGFPVLSGDLHQELSKPFSKDEVKRALF